MTTSGSGSHTSLRRPSMGAPTLPSRANVLQRPITVPRMLQGGRGTGLTFKGDQGYQSSS